MVSRFSHARLPPQSLFNTISLQYDPLAFRAGEPGWNDDWRDVFYNGISGDTSYQVLLLRSTICLLSGPASPGGRTRVASDFTMGSEEITEMKLLDRTVFWAVMLAYVCCVFIALL